jgi:hypothetical protein
MSLKSRYDFYGWNCALYDHRSFSATGGQDLHV